MAAPTFNADYEGASWDTTTSPKTTGTFNIAANDFLVAGLVDENFSTDNDYSFSNSGTALTWTEQTYSWVNNSDCMVQTATAPVSASQTGITVSGTRAAGSADKFNIVVAHFSGSDGLGATNGAVGVTGASPSVSITTSFADSALFVIAADWGAQDGASRTWSTINGFTPTAANGQELVYFRNSLNYTVFAAYYPNVGAAGSKTIQISNLTASSDTSFAVVEVRGSGGTSATVTASVIAAVASVPSVALSTGSTVSPAAVASVAAVPSTTLSTGSTVSPAAVAAVAGVPAPTILTGTNATATPATVAAIAAVPAASLSTGSTVSATAVAAVATVPAMTGATGSTVTPSAVAAVSALPAPTVTTAGSATIAATTIAAVAGVGAPTLSAGSTVTPSVVAAVAGLGSITFQAAATPTPTSVAAVASVGSSSLSTGSLVSPDTVATSATVGNITPQTAGAQYRFIPPNKLYPMEPHVQHGRLWTYFDFPVGIAVVKRTDGTYYQTMLVDWESPNLATVYVGGHIHTVDAAEAASLTAAGYGAYLTEIT